MFDRLRGLAFALSSQSPSLRGLWERVGDEFAGCLMLVEDSQTGLQGRITYVPATMRRCGWRVGDLKWRQIASQRPRSFPLLDLYKEVDPITKEVHRQWYQASTIYFVGANEFVTQAKGSGGRKTRWQRVAAA